VRVPVGAAPGLDDPFKETGTQIMWHWEETGDECTVDSPQSGNPPDPDKPAALRTSVSRSEYGCMTARPSPQQHLTLRTCPFRVSDLRTVNCSVFIPKSAAHCKHPFRRVIWVQMLKTWRSSRYFGLEIVCVGRLFGRQSVGEPPL
jgi:hypothetical protein